MNLKQIFCSHLYRYLSHFYLSKTIDGFESSPWYNKTILDKNKNEILERINTEVHLICITCGKIKIKTYERYYDSSEVEHICKRL